jgi:hypothetical protein
MGIQDPFFIAGLVFKAVGLILALKLSLPALAAALGFFAYRHGVSGGPSDVVPDGSDPVYEDLYGQLVSLGFEPDGQRKTEGCWNLGEKEGQWSHWDRQGELTGVALFSEGKLQQEVGSLNDLASNLRCTHWAIPLLIDPNLPPKSLRMAVSGQTRS